MTAGTFLVAFIAGTVLGAALGRDRDDGRTKLEPDELAHLLIGRALATGRAVYGPVTLTRDHVDPHLIGVTIETMNNRVRSTRWIPPMSPQLVAALVLEALVGPLDEDEGGEL